MRNAELEEAQTGIKIAGRNINNLRYADDTTLMAESEEELKSLLMKVKVESEKVVKTLLIRTISSVQFSCSVVSYSLGPRGLKDARLPCPWCGRLWQFAHPRPLSLLQRGLAPRSKGKACFPFGG